MTSLSLFPLTTHDHQSQKKMLVRRGGVTSSDARLSGRTVAAPCVVLSKREPSSIEAVSRRETLMTAGGLLLASQLPTAIISTPAAQAIQGTTAGRIPGKRHAATALAHTRMRVTMSVLQVCRQPRTPTVSSNTRGLKGRAEGTAWDGPRSLSTASKCRLGGARYRSRSQT